MATIIKWGEGPRGHWGELKWNDNPFTWNEVQLIQRAVEGFDNEPWQNWEKKEKNKLIKLICKVKGKTYKETKEINNYKIKVSDIKLLAEKVLGIEVIIENIKF